MMADIPVAAGFVGPPDMSRLSGGQRVLDLARTDLANHLDMQIMERKSVLDNAQDELANYITLTEANGKVALQNGRNALDRRINLTLGNAIQLANSYGVQVPPPTEIRTRSSWPAPAILQSSPGQSPQPPINGGRPYTGWDDSGRSPAEPAETDINCNTHLLPETQREGYRKVVETQFRDIVGITFLGDNTYDDIKYFVRIFPNWWSAHLYCHLATQCKWIAPRRDKWINQISNVALGPIGDGQEFGPVCEIADKLWGA